VSHRNGHGRAGTTRCTSATRHQNGHYFFQNVLLSITRQLSGKHPFNQVDAPVIVGNAQAYRSDSLH
jgi:hypothetical protein